MYVGLVLMAEPGMITETVVTAGDMPDTGQDLPQIVLSRLPGLSGAPRAA